MQSEGSGLKNQMARKWEEREGSTPEGSSGVSQLWKLQWQGSLDNNTEGEESSENVKEGEEMEGEASQTNQETLEIMEALDTNQPPAIWWRAPKWIPCSLDKEMEEDNSVE